jgi:hypothetical protein
MCHRPRYGKRPCGLLPPGPACHGEVVGNGPRPRISMGAERIRRLLPHRPPALGLGRLREVAGLQLPRSRRSRDGDRNALNRCRYLRTWGVVSQEHDQRRSSVGIRRDTDPDHGRLTGEYPHERRSCLLHRVGNALFPAAHSRTYTRILNRRKIRCTGITKDCVSAPANSNPTTRPVPSTTAEPESPAPLNAPLTPSTAKTPAIRTMP